MCTQRAPVSRGVINATKLISSIYQSEVNTVNILN